MKTILLFLSLLALGYSGEILARVTFYSSDTCPWGSQSATGVRLIEGKHAAVDPKKIPYGSTLYIPGLGERKAVDTGTAVKSRKAAKELGKTKLERQAVVVDIFVKNKKTMAQLAKTFPHFVKIKWST